MKKLIKLKQVFNHIKKEIDIKNLYICNILTSMLKETLISEDLYNNSVEFLLKNKPSETQYSEYISDPLWFGINSVWWSPVNEESEISVKVYISNKKSILKIKKQYLTELIKTIKQ